MKRASTRSGAAPRDRTRLRAPRRHGQNIRPSTLLAPRRAMPPISPPGPRPPGRIPYAPALDGLRGIALLVMLVYHGDFSWIGGGYLSVSTFFTLSGFLITSLLL